MRFNPKEYLAYYVMDKFTAEPNEKNFKECLDWLEPFGDFKLNVAKTEFVQDEEGSKFCTFYPYGIQHTIAVKSAQISGTYGITDLIIDGFFVGKGCSNIRIVCNNRGFKKGIKAMNAIVRDSERSFNGIYVYKNISSSLFNLDRPESLAFYDEETLKFLLEDLKVKEEKILSMTVEDFKRLGLEPDEFANPVVEENEEEHLPQLKDVLNNFTIEDFKNFVKKIGINNSSTKKL
jgi:hypothetical protein